MARSRRIAPGLVASSLFLALMSPASAHPGHGHVDLPIARLIAPVLGESAEVDTAEPPIAQRYPWTFPRSEVDRPDEISGPMVHVVYLVPAGMPDDHYDELGVLEDSLRSMNHWMRQQTGNQQWRLDTYTFQPSGSPTPVNAVDVTFIQSSKPSAELSEAESVRAELAAHGLDEVDKRYLTYVAADAGAVCGDAFVPISVDQTEVVDGKYAQVYLYSTEGCRPREFAWNATEPSYTEATAIHELVHNDGMVPMAAPHNCVVSPLAFGHVCTGPLWASAVIGNDLDPERFDLMYPFAGLPLTEKTLDADHLDYYRHPAPYLDLEQGLYLETV